MKKRKIFVENSNLKTVVDVFNSFDEMLKRLKLREQVIAMTDRLKKKYGYDYYSAIFNHETNTRNKTKTPSDFSLVYTFTDKTKKNRSYTVKFKRHGMSLSIDFKGNKSAMSFAKDINFADPTRDSAFGMSGSNYLELFLKEKNAGVQEFITSIEALISRTFQQSLLEVEKRLDAIYAQVQKAAADEKAENDKRDKERVDDFQSRKITGNSLVEKIADTKRRLAKLL